MEAGAGLTPGHDTPTRRRQMPKAMIRVLLFCLFGLAPSLAAGRACAAPEDYALDAALSSVRFSYEFDGREVTGRMPVSTAQMSLDLDNLPASRIEVTLDASAARAGFFFATQAMRGPQLLDAAHHPLIRFRSTQIRGDMRGATVTGALTLRGITRPMTLSAVLGRQPGSAPTDRSRLVVLLTGTIDRREFGASGYIGLVGPEIALRILAYIAK